MAKFIFCTGEIYYFKHKRGSRDNVSYMTFLGREHISNLKLSEGIIHSYKIANNIDFMPIKKTICVSLAFFNFIVLHLFCQKCHTLIQRCYLGFVCL